MIKHENINVLKNSFRLTDKMEFILDKEGSIAYEIFLFDCNHSIFFEILKVCSEQNGLMKLIIKKFNYITLILLNMRQNQEDLKNYSFFKN